MAKQVHVPTIQMVQKTVKVPQIQYEDQIGEVPVQKQVNVPIIEVVGSNILVDTVSGSNGSNVNVKITT